jgi:hypothetical protein
MRDEKVLLSVTITRDDLPSDGLRLLYDVIGCEATVAAVVGLAGISIYIPRSTLTMLKKRYVQRMFGELSVTELAVRLSLSEKVIYRWIDQKVPHRDSRYSDLQMRLAL